MTAEGGMGAERPSMQPQVWDRLAGQLGSVSFGEVTVSPQVVPDVDAITQVGVDPVQFSATTERHAQLVDEVRRLVAGKPLAERSAEEGIDDSWVHDEQYSHSIRLISLVGRLAVEGKLGTPEGIIAKESLRDRFRCSVVEMLHTDKVSREKLEILYERKHLVREGHIMALDGETDMAKMCERGAFKAAIEALVDPKMQTMADRCGADARVAKRVEDIPIGSVMMGLSVFPKEDMERFGKEFYENHGFREGLSFIQWYYRLDADTLLATSYSVDHHDLDSLRDVWNLWASKPSSEIPSDEVTNTWLDHDITRACTLEEARAMALRIRDSFYNKVGATNQRYSVDEFYDINEGVANELFDTLYMSMTVAQATKQMSNILSAFADGILAGKEHLSDEVQYQLLNIQRSERLADSDVALLEQLIRYAVTEHLRGGLNLIGKVERPQVMLLVPQGDAAAKAQYIASITAAGVIDGAKNNRTYGGCTVSITLGKKKDDGSDFNPLDVFGGHEEGEEEDDWSWTTGVCRVTACPTRPNQTMIGPCSVCKKCQSKFDTGMKLEQIVASYGGAVEETPAHQVERHAEKMPLLVIRGLGARVIADRGGAKTVKVHHSTEAEEEHEHELVPA